jgi:hypothetical protein
MIIDFTKKQKEKAKRDEELQVLNLALVHTIAEAVYEYPSLQFGQILYMLDIVDDDYHLGMPTMEYVDRVNTRVFDKGSKKC